MPNKPVTPAPATPAITPELWSQFMAFQAMMNATPTPATANTPATATIKTVTVTHKDSKTGVSKEYQVPPCPIKDGVSFTITVTLHGYNGKASGSGKPYMASDIVTTGIPSGLKVGSNIACWME